MAARDPSLLAPSGILRPSESGSAFAIALAKGRC